MHEFDKISFENYIALTQGAYYFFFLSIYIQLLRQTTNFLNFNYSAFRCVRVSG